MRDRLDELFHHCADLGIEVTYADLGDCRRGNYHDHHDRIVLNSRLTHRQTVACLAHEVGHAVFSDRCTFPAGERRAWEYGAALIVSPAEYEAAESIVGHHPGALAIELDVTPKLIEAWRRWYVKRWPAERAARSDDGLATP